MKRLIATVIAVAALVAIPAGCGSKSSSTTTSSQKGSIKIGMVSYTLAAPYFVGMAKAAESEASGFSNVQVLSTDANGDAAKLLSNVQDLLAKNVDGMIISAGPIESVPAALAAIKKAGIPIVEVDRKLKGADYASWLGPDNFAIGQQDGQYISTRLGGKGTLLIIRGGPADNTIGLARTNGVLDALKGSPNIKVIKAPGFGNWATDAGFTVMQDMLAKYSTINAVFCENDSMCLGAQKAIADAKRTNEMFLAGADGQKEALKAIMDGTNYGVTGLNNSDQIGRAGFNRLMAILAGAAPDPKDVVLPSPQITKDNAVKYYNPKSLF
jgi:ribose transport system substrate-binding protein